MADCRLGRSGGSGYRPERGPRVSAALGSLRTMHLDRVDVRTRDCPCVTSANLWEKTGHRVFARHYGLSSRPPGRVTAQNDKVRCPPDAVVELLLGATRVLHSRARAKQAATQRNDGSRRGSWTVSSQPAWLAAALYSRRFNRIMGKPMPYGELQRSFL